MKTATNMYCEETSEYEELHTYSSTNLDEETEIVYLCQDEDGQVLAKFSTEEDACDYARTHSETEEIVQAEFFQGDELYSDVLYSRDDFERDWD